MKFTTAILSLTFFSANFVSPIAAQLRGGVQSICSDSPPNWHFYDDYGSYFDCAWYADAPLENRCSLYGQFFPPNIGLTAIQACCACGGGAQTPSGPPPALPESPTVGGEKIVKVKVLVSPDLLSQGWTEADTRNELEQANILLASSNINDIRFVLHDQQTAPSGLFGTNSDANFVVSSDFGAADIDHRYNIIMYLNKIDPSSGINIGNMGLADPFLCASNPSAVVANVYSYITVAHELMHTLGADHDSVCNDGYINTITSTTHPNAHPGYFGQPEVTLGMSTCNINVMKTTIPTYNCLASPLA